MARWFHVVLSGVVVVHGLVTEITDWASPRPHPVLNLPLAFFDIFWVRLWARGFGARIEVEPEQLVLHSILRTRWLKWADIGAVVEGHWLASRANVVRLKDGQEMLFPAGTQGKDRKRLKKTREEIDAAHIAVSGPDPLD